VDLTHQLGRPDIRGILLLIDLLLIAKQITEMLNIMNKLGKLKLRQRIILKIIQSEMLKVGNENIFRKLELSNGLTNTPSPANKPYRDSSRGSSSPQE